MVKKQLKSYIDALTISPSVDAIKRALQNLKKTVVDFSKFNPVHESAKAIHNRGWDTETGKHRNATEQEKKDFRKKLQIKK